MCRQHLLKDVIKSDDRKNFPNYLEGKKGYLSEFNLKSKYYVIDIFKDHQIYLVLAENLIKIKIINSLLSYVLTKSSSKTANKELWKA